MLLRVVTVAEKPYAAGEALLTVAPAESDGGSKVERRAAVAAPVEIDVSSLLRTGTPPAFQVGVDHPLYLPTSTFVALRAERGAVRIEEVRIELVRAGAVRGQVMDEKGGLLPGVDVALFGQRDDEPVDEVRTREDGRFHLRAVREGRFRLVAFGRGRAPAGRRVSLRIGHIARLAEPLVLRAGAVIRGRVTNGAGKPMANVRVEAELQRKGSTIALRGPARKLRIRGSEVKLALTRARSRADGTYILPGLVPARYAVWCGYVPGGLPALTDRTGQRVVVAPMSDVDFVLRFATLRILVRAGGEPAKRAPVMLFWDRGNTRQGSGSSADEKGVFERKVPPGIPLGVKVTHEGFLEHQGTVLGIPAGESREVTIDLLPDAARSTLGLRVDVEDGEIPEQLAVGFFPKDTSRNTPTLTRIAVLKQGVFRLEGLPPGAYRLRLRAGSSWSFNRSFLVDGQTEAELTPGHETYVRVGLVRGGRIRLWVRTVEGRPLSAHCNVVNRAGEESQLGFHGRNAHGNLSSDSSGIPRPAAHEPYDSERALLPGSYTLKLCASGYRERTFEVEIEAGRVTEVRATLEPTTASRR